MPQVGPPRHTIGSRQRQVGNTTTSRANNTRYVGVILVVVTVAVLFFNSRSIDSKDLSLLEEPKEEAGEKIRNLDESSTSNQLQAVQKENQELKDDLTRANLELETLRTDCKIETDKSNARLTAAQKENQALQEKYKLIEAAAKRDSHRLRDELETVSNELDTLRKKTKTEADGGDVMTQKNEILQQKESYEALIVQLASTQKELAALTKTRQYDGAVETEKQVALKDPVAKVGEIMDNEGKLSPTNSSQMVAPCKPIAWPTPPEGTSSELQQIWDTTTPWCNTTISALYTKQYFAGLRNQVMAFTVLIMYSLHDGHNQILLETLRHKDTYGSGKLAPHEALFDVAHWNSFYPKLPRMVHCDPGILLDYNCSTGVFMNSSYHMPLAYKTFKNQHFTAYSRYSKRKGPLADPFPNPADLLIKAGALRPHPDLRAIGDRLMTAMNDNATLPYMTLHARIEPDMQKHPVCRDLKVLNLTTIVEFLETKWKDPPVSRVFLPVNRQYLEKEGKIVGKDAKEETNWIAVNNLKELNRIGKEGLWGGRVTVFEFGANALKGTKYEKLMSSIGGSILNYHIATNAEIFVGTEISSYSNDLVATRFYSGNFNNYFYRPDGLHLVTTKESAEPPAFEC